MNKGHMIEGMDGRGKYFTAHPQSAFGNANYADAQGWELVCIQPWRPSSGLYALMIFRRKPWYKRVFG